MAEITRAVLMGGAGAAGHTAANDLRKAGLSVAVLEARDRAGGRRPPDGLRVSASARRSAIYRNTYCLIDNVRVLC